VKRREDLSGLVKLACDRYGKIDVLVSNAGIGLISPLDDLRVEDWEEMIDVNLKGVLYGIAAALPVFASRATVTSSTPCPPPDYVLFRSSRCTPVRRTPYALSTRGCDRRPATACA
jgi:NAD(P)-dependent dehydrogenase (short-subunit alcohol dehydrogenase family)